MSKDRERVKRMINEVLIDLGVVEGILSKEYIESKEMIAKKIKIIDPNLIKEDGSLDVFYMADRTRRIGRP